MIGYKYRELNDQKTLVENIHIKTLLDNQIYASEYHKLNDPFEAESDEIISDLPLPFLKLLSIDAEKTISTLAGMSQLKDKLGFYSLSKDINNILLWAYYANSQKGFAIGYDVDILKDNHDEQAYLLDVKYSSNIPFVGPNDIRNLRDNNNYKPLFTKLFASKSKDWEREKEIRIVFDTFGLKQYNPKALKSIYFGLNMDPLFKNRMMELFSNRNVEFYEMVKVKKTYKIEAEFLCRT